MRLILPISLFAFLIWLSACSERITVTADSVIVANAAQVQSDNGSRLEIVARSARAQGELDGPSDQALFSAIAAIAVPRVGPIRALESGRFYGDIHADGVRIIDSAGTVTTQVPTGWSRSEYRLVSSSVDHELGEFYFIRSELEQGRIKNSIVAIDNTGSARLLTGNSNAEFTALPDGRGLVAVAGTSAKGFWLLDQPKATVYRLTRGEPIKVIPLAQVFPGKDTAYPSNFADASSDAFWLTFGEPILYKISDKSTVLSSIDLSGKMPSLDGIRDFDSKISRVASDAAGGAYVVQSDRQLLRRVYADGKIEHVISVCAVSDPKPCEYKRLQGKPARYDYVIAPTPTTLFVSDGARIYSQNGPNTFTKIAGFQKPCLDAQDRLMKGLSQPCVDEFYFLYRAQENGYVNFLGDPTEPTAFRWSLALKDGKTTSSFFLNYTGLGVLEKSDEHLQSMMVLTQGSNSIDVGSLRIARGGGPKRPIYMDDRSTLEQTVLVPGNALPYNRNIWRPAIAPNFWFAHIRKEQLLIADEANSLITLVDLKTRQRRIFAGNAKHSEVKDGVGTSARLARPVWFGNSDNGEVFLLDGGSDWLRSVKPDGSIESVARFPVATVPPGPCVSNTIDIVGIWHDSEHRLWVALQDNRVFIQIGKELVHFVGSKGNPGTRAGPLPSTLGKITGLIPGLAGDMFIVTRDAIARVHVGDLGQVKVPERSVAAANIAGGGCAKG
jgi:hypothetical protein